MDNTNYTFIFFYRHKKVGSWPSISTSVVKEYYAPILKNIQFEFKSDYSLLYEPATKRLSGLEITSFYSKPLLAITKNYSKIYFYLKETAEFFSLDKFTTSGNIREPYYLNEIKLKVVEKPTQRLLFRRYRSLLLLEAL